MTKHPTFDRILFALCIISAWALPSIFLWAFTQPNDLPLWWNGAGIICSCVLFLCAFVMTFVIGGLRYVLTGSEFPEDTK